MEMAEPAISPEEDAVDFGDRRVPVWPSDVQLPDGMNGVLMFADPRMEACCRHKPHYVSTPAVPPMGPGSMIIFPAHFTHLVTPYSGRRPRISIAWNINADGVEGDLRHDGVLS